ncbi:hypothetical protein NM688_g1703 [Phlebia brevispora]|uniref:Uncharacterized protein n=1 Tax=Phlebia brevispora TaxID=194682 RepID=A0ACC1TAN8_9APHY|nr:hypothetical protein NM688_g1703 [Phlebia brevispora]
MSFVCLRGKPVRFAWPPHLPQVKKDPLVTKLTGDALVPEDAEDINEWAIVKESRVAGSSNVHALIYSSSLASGRRPEQVAIRIQGYIAEKKLGEYGDWNGTEAHAPKARQYIVLHGGEEKELFDAQCRAITNIREAVLRSLYSSKHNTDQNGRIYLHNQVFTKVRHGSTLRKKSTSRTMSDPLKLAKKIDHLWVAENNLTLAFQDAKGRILTADPSKFKCGDFVDVKVVVNVITYPMGDAREVRVLFNMTRIIQLCPASIVNQQSKKASEQLEDGEDYPIHDNFVLDDEDDKGEGSSMTVE